MFYWRRVFVLLLMLAGSVSLCSGATGEMKAFDKAAAKFNHAMWEFAAQDFGAFVTNYPTSFRVPEAILYQAQAHIKNSNFDSGVALLTSNQHRAGDLGDLYLYWIAQGHLGRSNYTAAAEAFGKLVEQFPASTNRLEAMVSQAAAFSKAEDWAKVVELLGGAGSAFRSAAEKGGDWAVRGYLLLGEAQLRRGNLMQAGDAVAPLDPAKLRTEFVWQRWYLQTRIELADERVDDARATSTNLLAAADTSGNTVLRAQTYALIGSIFEKLRSLDRAIACYEQNLTNSVPLEQQRLALLKIAELSLAQNKAGEAVRRLERYQRDYPRSEAADTVLLTLGELHLKQAVAQGDIGTNQLGVAQAQFESLLAAFPNSALVGKALAGKGWCLWYAGDMTGAEAAFRDAIQRLPLSEGQAVARFKLADSYFNAGDFNKALESYRDLVTVYATNSEVKPLLLEQALYQAARAALAVTNLAEAEAALDRMLEWYPNGLMGDRCLFLVAEGYAQHSKPDRARDLFQRFEQEFGATNALLPKVRLAISRTFEKEGNWTDAISNYNSWIATFTNHIQLPEAKFSRAWDMAMAGSETNALNLFTNFVAEFPAHELAPRAKWWIGDYYFRNGKNALAEENYPWTTNYMKSELFFPAHMRAGMAAMARFSYKDAISYFSALMDNPRCPPDLRIKGAMAAGDAYMSRNEPGSTNRTSDLEQAIECFRFVLKNFPASTQVPHAWGRMGDCFKEMGAANPKMYDTAVDAYARVIAFTNLATGTWRQAKVALGVVAEARAESRKEAEQKALLKEALRHYSDAFFAEPLRRNEADDLFWYQKAGMETAQLAEKLGETAQATEVYRTLLKVPNLSPAVQTTLNRRLLKLREQSAALKP